jgi:hypothetical protein
LVKNAITAASSTWSFHSAFSARIGVVAAQDDPFGELAGDRILDGGLVRIGIGHSAFAGGFDHPLDRGDVVGRGRGGRRDGKLVGQSALWRMEHRRAGERQFAEGKAAGDDGGSGDLCWSGGGSG